jgi:hypothetical protein
MGIPGYNLPLLKKAVKGSRHADEIGLWGGARFSFTIFQAALLVLGVVNLETFIKYSRTFGYYPKQRSGLMTKQV